ncbi:winged helix-turn-helix transcriptional regulator [Sphingomonas sp. FW199]|uniref:winged helix-turn-helix transcriptional regulator n=1 Tax=Sphingomonas sp. FW199 TaxID=3400217 RepID=UPI003CF7CCDC
MKLEKQTNLPPPGQKRWYDDGCGTALGLELIGERWSLLIVRELMFGGRRFSELRAGLPGISANVLTQRLEGLERVGIVTRRKLPPPASVQVYELTPWGLEAETLIQELGRWAVRSPLHDPTLPLSAASIMMSFRTMYDADRARGEAARIGFRIGAEAFVVSFDGAGPMTQRAEPEGCDLVLIAPDAMALAAIVYGDVPVADAEGAGMVAVNGDRDLLARFIGWFPLPAKIDA